MKAFGFAALVIALAVPAAAQQIQSNQPRQDTAAGAAQEPGQSGRTTPNDTTANDPATNDTNSSNRASQPNSAQQGDQGAAATSGRNDRGGSGAAEQNNSQLPATASPLAALGVLGLVSFAGAALVRRMRTRER